MGQTDSILCYYLVSQGGSDQEMQDALGLKVSQFVGLMGDTPQSEADALLGAQEARQHVERLVQRGLLTRGADSADRRTVHLLPTPAAQEAIAQGRAAQEEIGRWMLRGISAEDQAALSRVLTQMLDNLRDFKSCRP